MNISQALHAYLSKLRLFSRNARYVLFASFLTGMAFGGYRLLFNFYVLSLGDQYNESFLGTLQTAQSLAAILFALPAAYAAGRFAPKLLLIVIAVLSGISVLGVVLVPTAASLIVFRMLFGVTFAAREVVVAPFLMANTDAEERQWVFSFNLGLTMTALFLGNTVGGSLPSLFAALLNVDPNSATAYQGALTVIALVASSTLLPILALRRSKKPKRTQTKLPWHLLGEHWRKILPFFLPQIVIGLGAGLMQPFMNLYFRVVYGQPDPVIGLVFAFGGISMALAQFIAPPLADRLGKINAVILSQGLSVPFLLLLGTGAFVVPSGIGAVGLWFAIAVLAYNVRLGLMNMGNPIYQTFMLEQVPDDVAALAVSLSSISFQLGWFVMPQVGGWLQVSLGDFGFVPIFFTVAFFYILAIIMEYVFFKDIIRARRAQTA